MRVCPVLLMLGHRRLPTHLNLHLPWHEQLLLITLHRVVSRRMVTLPRRTLSTAHLPVVGTVQILNVQAVTPHVMLITTLINGGGPVTLLSIELLTMTTLDRVE